MRRIPMFSEANLDSIPSRHLADSNQYPKLLLLKIQPRGDIVSNYPPFGSYERVVTRTAYQLVINRRVTQ
jgi:hypothetical protein